MLCMEHSGPYTPVSWIEKIFPSLTPSGACPYAVYLAKTGNLESVNLSVKSAWSIDQMQCGLAPCSLSLRGNLTKYTTAPGAVGMRLLRILPEFSATSGIGQMRRRELNLILGP